MTTSDKAEELRLAIDRIGEHAQRYKQLFHDMQDKLIEALDEKAARGRIIEQQGRIIADLEARLGIDQDL